MCEFEIDQEPDCLQCGYSGYWAQVRRPPADKSWICDECYNSGVDEGEEDCPECGYYCHAMQYGGPCRDVPTSSFYDGDYDVCDFADPGGRSALRRETEDNPRDQPCPTCEAPNRLTPADVALGYQCDRCADRAEMGMEY